MTEQASAPEPFTREDAVRALMETPAEPTPTPEAAPETAKPEVEPEPQGETSTPEEATAEPVELAEGEEAEAEVEAVEPAEPPKYWSKDAKAQFAELSPEMQAVVLAQEGPREEATAKAKAEAAKAVEAAQKELQGVQNLAQQLSDFLPQAVETFQRRWGEPDWAKVVEEQGAEQAFVLKAQYENEQKQLQQVAHANQTAQVKAHEAFIQTEWKALAGIEPELAPDVSDPTKGADKRQEVTKFLMDRGVPQDAVARISAAEMSLAYDAMRWRSAQAALKAAPKSPPIVPQAKAQAKPGAPPPRTTIQQRDAATLQNRFNQTKSRDDAVALILAKGL